MGIKPKKKKKANMLKIIFCQDSALVKHQHLSSSSSCAIQPLTQFKSIQKEMHFNNTKLVVIYYGSNSSTRVLGPDEMSFYYYNFSSEC